MERETSRPERNFAVLENVRCLDCGAVYAKPTVGGTVEANPGCPECGYVGWVAVSMPVSEGRSLIHSFEDRPQHRTAQSG
jgi:hypothetical protein